MLGFTGALDLLTGAQRLLAAGPACVAVTQGSKGALIVSNEETIEVPAFAVDVVDTTGCGDAFSAGFILGRALGRDLRQAARLGCATAAQVAGGIGTDAGAYDLARSRRSPIPGTEKALRANVHRRRDHTPVGRCSHRARAVGQHRWTRRARWARIIPKVRYVRARKTCEIPNGQLTCTQERFRSHVRGHGSGADSLVQGGAVAL